MPASPTPNATAVALARLAVVTGPNDQTGDSVTVHFNPASLQLQLSNELKDTRNNERKQYIAKATAKLTMDLQFDTTDTGADVMDTTRKLQAYLAPPLPASDRARQQLPPPVVLFEWGTLRFKGIAESYRETVDFFSANGVPLRASVNLTLSRQDQVFDEAGESAPANAGSVDSSPFDTPASSASGAANALSAPGAARALAAANGEESLRFSAGASLTVSGGISLKPPAAFASGGAGLSVGAGLGLGISGGAGVGLGVSAGAAGSTGLAGVARLSATEGAFAGLRVAANATPTARLDPSKLMPKPSGAGISTDTGATFQAGGKATVPGAAGLRANVGASARITFDAG